jgi:hypothetical protein
MTEFIGPPYTTWLRQFTNHYLTHSSSSTGHLTSDHTMLITAYRCLSWNCLRYIASSWTTVQQTCLLPSSGCPLLFYIHCHRVIMWTTENTTPVLLAAYVLRALPSDGYMHHNIDIVWMSSHPYALRSVLYPLCIL